MENVKQQNYLGHLASGMKEVLSLKNNIHDVVTLTTTSKGMMTVMLLSQLVAFILGKSFDLMGWIGLITGISAIMNLILVDQGRLTNYSWGILQCAVWFVVAINNRLVGDMFSQGFYFLMQFVGVSIWHRDIAKDAVIEGDTAELKAKKMSKLTALLTVLGTIIVYFIVLFVSLKANGSNPYIDAALLPLGIAGQILMTYGYRSQWIVWLILDAINIEVWAVQLSNGGAAAFSMFILQIVMFINAVYGAYLWFKPQENKVA
ncbi:nicotinamide mononucleotide transporter [Ligilactobacillus sp. WC1T17]|uniref:Nicotinamide mononucleotide transporter n=1 Tax=Ligilactobacillus ruminis TaxID=1623 RepID=A0ABY1AD67_9LACO|nr:nicotinamide mononucleotide transporter [Ligilactobacillus ruminis]